MFEPSAKPRVFATPPGVDFSTALVAGFRARAGSLSPFDIARATIYTNTSRSLFDITQSFAAFRPGIFPSLRLISALADLPVRGLPMAAPRLERVLDVAVLLRRLFQAEPGIAAPSTAFDLADSVVSLFEEMGEEGVDPAALGTLDVTDHSGHWQQSLRILGLVAQHFGPGRAPPCADARLRAVADHLQGAWTQTPPDAITIVAGSTGSRGGTLSLMNSVARLPRGALVLPGFDRDMPPDAWSQLVEREQPADHPQVHYARLLRQLDLRPKDVLPWDTSAPANPSRNRLVSLALRPPPLTDRWRAELHGFADLDLALNDLTLLTAPTEQDEAKVIAVALRHAVGRGKQAVLVTPNRSLARRVSAALSRWNLRCEDFAGEPLALSPAGRLFLLSARFRAEPLVAGRLIALLKHPLTARGSADRADHLRRVRELERGMRQDQALAPDLRRLARTSPEDAAFADWLEQVLAQSDAPGDELPAMLSAHRAFVDLLYAGPQQTGGSVHDAEDGMALAAILDQVAASAALVGALGQADYLALLQFVFRHAQTRGQRDPAHVEIWGTIDARNRLPEYVVLGSLNEGVWPPAPTADPWLNRQMRAALGLRLPERETALAAHDFQQAIAAREVLITRALRSGEAESVPSRWLNRLTTVIGTAGERDISDRAAPLVVAAQALERPNLPPQPVGRPAPIPPVASRPKQLSLTEVGTLARNPYDIYARHVLRLNALPPLKQLPDARDRGTVLHGILEQFAHAVTADTTALTEDGLLAVARDILARDVPWSAERLFWLGHVSEIAENIVAQERDWRALGPPLALERRARWPLPGLEMTLKAKADRINLGPLGAILIDYKSHVPTLRDLALTAQVEIEALMLAEGCFDGLDATPAQSGIYIGLDRDQKTRTIAFDAAVLEEVRKRLFALIAHYLAPDSAFLARRNPSPHASDFDHLARYGEWQDSDAFLREVLK